MTNYHTIGAQDSISSTRAHLNGVSTRTERLPFTSRYSESAAAPPTRVTTGIVTGEEFQVNDVLFTEWPVPPDIDRTVDLTVTLVLVSRSAESSKTTSFELQPLVINPTGNSSVATATGTITSGLTDLAIPSSDQLSYKASATLVAGTYLPATCEMLSCRVKRVTSSADPVSGQVLLIGLWVTYGIVRG